MKNIVQRFREIRPIKRYTLAGFLFGVLFPVAANIVIIIFEEIPLSEYNLFQSHVDNPLLFVVNTAPIVLGVLFYIIGIREEELEKVNQNLEIRVIQRTQELKAEIKEKENAQKESERQAKYFQALIENSPTAVVMLDNDQSIMHCNPAFENLFGYNCAEITGQDIDGLVTTEDTREEAAALTQSVMTTSVQTISQRKRSDGTIIDVEVFGVPIFIGGERSGALAMYHDISTLVQARESAEEANRAKSEFLANMSHEIRTPMDGVIGMLDIALDTNLNKEQTEYITIALQSAEALLTLLNDILDYSKIEAKKLELETINFDLRTAIEGVAYTLARRAEEKGLELAAVIPPELPTRLVGDPSRLRQILINLAGNAIKFTEWGEVVIRTEAIEEDDKRVRVKFSVTDTGIGIKKDRLKAIFERFTQADGSTTRKFGGTGLGLAISQHLVEAMGGTISVESEYGRGSNFFFMLEFKKQAKEDYELENPIKDLKGLKTLIIDDNATNRAILLKMVEGFGAKAHAVSGGAEGLKALQEAREEGELYDLVLLDMQMPEMDGEQTARAIFSDPRKKHLSVVVLTSMGKRGDAKRLEELGCAGYLLKPIKQRMLFEALLTIMNEKKTKPLGTGRLVTRHTINEQKQNALRILLAEDNPVNQKVAIALLKKAGHTVDVVDDGKKALENNKRRKYSLILMDVQMPIMDGLEATRHIRMWEAGKEHTPIIAMTAHAMQGDRDRCIEAGMDDYIAKPLDKRVLFTTIERWGKNIDTEKSDKKRFRTAPFVDVEKTNITPLKQQISSKRTQPKPDSRPIGNIPVNIDDALIRFDNDRDFFNEMAEDFVNHLPNRLEELKTCYEKVDAIGVSRAAHNLKGMAATFSARELTKLAERLELGTRHGELHQAEALITEIEAEIKKVCAYFATLDIHPHP